MTVGGVFNSDLILKFNNSKKNLVNIFNLIHVHYLQTQGKYMFLMSVTMHSFNTRTPEDLTDEQISVSLKLAWFT